MGGHKLTHIMHYNNYRKVYKAFPSIHTPNSRLFGDPIWKGDRFSGG